MQSGTYGSARDLYPSANTVLSGYSSIPDRDGYLLMFQTYSTDIYDTGAHPDDQSWGGWQPFYDNCKLISNTLQGVGGLFSSLPDMTDEVKGAYTDLQARIMLYDRSGVTGIIDTEVDNAANAADKVGNAIKNNIGTIGGIAVVAVAFFAFLLYTSAKSGGSVV